MGMIYFISDAHLGSRALTSIRTRERRLVNFLEAIKEKATAVYMLGDIFDFWYEYRNVVPKGYTRFLGKVSELTDRGVEVHFLIGNHDIWCKNYLTEECGVVMHYEPCTVELYGQLFYLAHGDGLGDMDWKFRILRSMFHNPLLQWMFSAIHPRWSVHFGLEWARRSRLKHEREGVPRYMGEQGEPLVVYSKEYLRTHPDINYFIYGHRHIELDLMLSRETRLLILGEWTDLCTYAVFDGEKLVMENFIEGETKP